MTQKQVDFYKLKKNISTQTGYDYEFSLCLSNAKRVRFYYSENYKDYVISFNYGSCQKFIINRAMFKRFRTHFDIINKIYGNE